MIPLFCEFKIATVFERMGLEEPSGNSLSSRQSDIDPLLLSATEKILPCFFTVLSLWLSLLHQLRVFEV